MKGLKKNRKERKKKKESVGCHTLCLSEWFRQGSVMTRKGCHTSAGTAGGAVGRWNAVVHTTELCGNKT